MIAAFSNRMISQSVIAVAVDIRSGCPVIEYDEREIDDPDGVGLPNDAAAIDMREELSTISSAARVLRRAVRAMGAILVRKGWKCANNGFRSRA